MSQEGQVMFLLSTPVRQPVNRSVVQAQTIRNPDIQKGVAIRIVIEDVVAAICQQKTCFIHLCKPDPVASGLSMSLVA